MSSPQTAEAAHPVKPTPPPTIDAFIPPRPPDSLAAKFTLKFVDWLEHKICGHAINGNTPVYDTALFPWVAEVEKESHLIQAELERVLERREELPNFQDICTNLKITSDDHWKTYIFMAYGVTYHENLGRCPETARIMKKIPGLKTAFFSVLSPRKYIPAHRGPYNGVLRFHLGLKIPEPREKCRIRVADQFIVWENRRGVVFDDSFNHEVWNDTEGVRVVLFVDFVRPVKWPYNWLNRLVLSLAMFSPYIREATHNQKKWEQQFYARR